MAIQVPFPDINHGDALSAQCDKARNHSKHDVSRMIPSSDEQLARGTSSEDCLMSMTTNVFRRAALRRFLRISNSAQKTRVFPACRMSCTFGI